MVALFWPSHRLRGEHHSITTAAVDGLQRGRLSLSLLLVSFFRGDVFARLVQRPSVSPALCVFPIFSFRFVLMTPSPFSPFPFPFRLGGRKAMIAGMDATNPHFFSFLNFGD